MISPIRWYHRTMSGERILIVEDERAVARGLEYGLRSEGFSVLWADTGQRALELARNQDPKLILLDIRLPDISGFDVCRQLRSGENASQSSCLRRATSRWTRSWD